VEEALRSEVEITEVFMSESFFEKERNRNLVEALDTRSHSVSESSEKVFSSIKETNTSQGIIALARRPKNSQLSLGADIKKRGHCPVILFLDQINNPSNLGAIVRTAEAAEAIGVMVSPGSADAYSPKALRASMGSAFRVPIRQEMVFGDALTYASENGMKSVAADIRGDIAYLEVDWTKPQMLIFGSEARGLDEAKREKLDTLTFIPMNENVESLNLAVSAGVILFEARRQNESKAD